MSLMRRRIAWCFQSVGKHGARPVSRRIESRSGGEEDEEGHPHSKNVATDVPAPYHRGIGAGSGVDQILNPGPPREVHDGPTERSTDLLLSAVAEQVGNETANTSLLPTSDSASADYGILSPERYGFHDVEGNLRSVLQIIQTNSAISEAYLQNCNIGDAGANALGAVLYCNTNLRTLWLHNCFLGEIGGVSLARALEKNNRLQQLHLNGITINQEGATALAQVLREQNHTLGQFEFDPEGVEELHELIQKYIQINQKFSPFEAEARKTGKFPLSYLVSKHPLGGHLIPLVIECVAKTEMIGVMFDLVHNTCGDMMSCMEDLTSCKWRTKSRFTRMAMMVGKSLLTKNRLAEI